jgi:beta-lactamase regulating signal transducer with metallopeptidase domain
MMTHDVFELLIRAAISVSIAVAIVMVLRGPVCRVFGARVAYAFWILVPVTLLANFLPAQQISIMERTPITDNKDREAIER